MSVKLMLGDCLERMKEIFDGSVDMVLADPPYGTTACKWDSVIPLEPMWEQLKRVIKPNGAIVMTASQPFTTTLISSNMKMFKYCWVWNKTTPVGHVVARVRPMQLHEDVCVFSTGTMLSGGSRNNMVYNPQDLKFYNKIVDSTRQLKDNEQNQFRRNSHKKNHLQEWTNYPKTIIQFNKVLSKRSVHPTQKPVALMEYLIKTYTNEGAIVLDFAMGSGSTGVACIHTGRSFIGIELDLNYFEVARKRISCSPYRIKREIKS